MNRCFITIVLFILSVSLSAQHMSFMGIPMGTHINTFRQSILSKGFKPTPAAAPDIYCFDRGTFSGYRVTLNVQVTPKTQKVYSVIAIFVDFLHFKSGRKSLYGSTVPMKEIIRLYDDLTKKLSSKYGNYFRNNYDDPQFLRWNVWQSNGGYIGLVIVNFNNDPDCVKMYIEYLDEATRRLSIKEYNDDL